MNEDNTGCINPHGMYPFSKDRESCPDCQRIRAQRTAQTRKRGLPYGWWKSGLFWDTVSLLVLGMTGVLIFLAWLFDWKPTW